MSDRVVVGMSGGVDSSVAACLLQQQGFGVEGVTMRLFDTDVLPAEMQSACCSIRDVDDARQVAQRLGIPHHVLWMREEFHKNVMDRFVECYRCGYTPNPCVDCNRYLKFGSMLRRALEMDIPYVATGHYARRSRCGERYLLKKGLDPDKDQSYFLYHLTQFQLAHFQLPLGELTKTQVREVAARNGFGNAEKKDSQDICFVPDGDYGAFLERYTGVRTVEGNYVNRSGEVLGTHRGHERYTIGQRRGLELAMGHRVYVTGKDAARNLVYIGENEDLFGSALEAEDLNFIACDSIPSPIRCTVKIRHSRQQSAATVEQTDKDRLVVRFDRPQRAITPGQSVVLYDEDTVIGGGMITKAL